MHTAAVIASRVETDSDDAGSGHAAAAAAASSSGPAPTLDPDVHMVDGTAVGEQPMVPPNWPPRVCFGRALTHLLPFDPVVRAHLLAHGAVIVLPSRGDRSSLRFDPDARDAQSYAPTSCMTLGCINTGGSFVVTMPQPVAPNSSQPQPQVCRSLHPAAIDLQQVQRFLDADWAALLTPTKESPRPAPPAALANRLYTKDVSEAHDRPRGFFPLQHKLLRGILTDTTPSKPKHKAAASAASAQRLAWLAQHFQRLDELKKSKPGAADFFTHALHMDELQLHRESLSLLSALRLDGAEGYYLYEKLGFQFFNLHIEQMLFTFIHHQLEGESLWFLIPFGQLPKLYTLAADMYRVLYRVTPDSLTLTHEEFERHCLVMGRALLYSKQLWPPLSLLNKHGISYRVLVLSKDDILTADGDCAHFGFSTRPGQTISVASNIATSRWLQRGLPFLVDYFTWMGELERILQQHHAGWLQLPPPLGPPSIHQLKSPLELATKAVNLCPINFACSFVRGLYADMDAMRHGSEPVGEYPCKPDADECLRHQRLCVQVVTLIHARRDFIQQVDDKSCRSCDTHDSNTDIQHTCMLCLCRGRYATQLHGSHLVTNCPAAVANKAIN